MQALGPRHAGTWDRMAPHTPREDVVAAAAGARAVRADLIVTVGGGSITDAAKLVQTCLSNDVVETSQLDALRLRPGEPMTIEHLTARLDAQVAMWLSTVGSQAGVNKGASHAIGHALGGTGGVPHGYTSCILMPHVLRFNHPVAAERQALISQALGEPGTDAATLVGRLIADLGLPTRLRDVGITTDAQLDAVAEAAMHDPWIRTNPRAIDDASVVRALLDAAR